MVSLELVVFLFCAILTVIGIGTLPFLFIIGYLKNREGPRLHDAASVTVIVPCKDHHPQLRENLQAICRQDYPSFQVLFILDSSSDSAYPDVAAVIQGVAQARCLFARTVPNTSGKISALLTGLDSGRACEVLVFADSDIRPSVSWLRDLVAPLDEAKVGASTGYRWFMATSLKSAFISTWSLSTVSASFYSFANFAWGGSMAMRTELFDKLGIANEWRTGLSDDLILTKAVKAAGYRIRFVPQSMVESPVDENLRSFIRWGSQQITWMRWYSPLAWAGYYFGVLFVTAVLVMDAVLFVQGDMLFGILLGVTLALEMVYGWIGVWTFEHLMRYPRERFHYKLWYGLLAPVAFLLYAYNALVSSVKREIRWCGKVYRKRDLARLTRSMK